MTQPNKILFFLTVSDAFLIASVAHCDIGIVAAEEHLASFGDYVTVFVYSRVDVSFSAAGTDGLDLGDRVRDLEKTHRAGEELGEKVCAQTEAEYRYVQLVNHAAQLIYIFRGKELALVRDNNVCVVLVEGEELKYVVTRPDGGTFCGETDSGAKVECAVTVIE